MFASRRIIVGAALGLAVAAGPVAGQDYPARPIHIFAAAAGGGNDFAARQVAQGIAGPLGQPVVVENRPQGMISAEAVAKAPPDGYTLLTGGSSQWIRPLFETMRYDAVRDFAPISQVTRELYIVVVNPAVPANSVKELIAYAKERPGVLNYAVPGLAGTQHLLT